MQQQEQDTARKIVPLTIDKAVWKNLGPARGMGGLYSHIEGFRTGTQLLHVYAYEAQAIAAVPDMIRALLSIEQMARGTTIGRMARAALNGAFISQECFGPQQGCQTGQPDNTDVTPLLDIVECFAANGVETAPQFPAGKERKVSTIKINVKGAQATKFMADFQPLRSLWEGDDAPYPSEYSARWELRKLRDQLAEHEAVAVHRGRILIHPARFAEVAEKAAIEMFSRRASGE